MYHSQFQEDKLLSEYIAENNLKISNFFVDIGAADINHGSNSRHFIENQNFKALLLEPGDRFFNELNTYYSSNSNVKVVQAVIASEDKIIRFNFDSEPTHSGISDNGKEVMGFKLSTLLKNNDYKDQIGILSIDTEGYEFLILKSIFADNINPTFVIAESNDRKSRNDLQKLMEDNGYELAIETAKGYFFDLNPIRRKFRKALALLGIKLPLIGVNTIWHKKS
jgi:FkbM family methyltransferase